MLLHVHRSDAGLYACVVANTASRSEASFRVTVVTHLTINSATSANAERYTCHAENEVSNLFSSDFLLEIIASTPPKLQIRGAPRRLRHDDVPGALGRRQGHQLALGRGAERQKYRLTDGGKYACRASNEAGSTKVPLLLKVLVPPQNDKLNIVRNQLAILVVLGEFHGHVAYPAMSFNFLTLADGRYCVSGAETDDGVFGARFRRDPVDVQAALCSFLEKALQGEPIICAEGQREPVARFVVRLSGDDF
ncbi:hypothetical protein QR680_002890 [Steinernema hermaphroditum]|uniref:Ig-like domain-containing protein n=1 Tax=Steinernema hermaphroditum TaxID=289476 RepID=A0AA39LJ03_9BILA|nr:hypothetical protein QR680_002890 [Steinernema hermaphroditum]